MSKSVPDSPVPFGYKSAWLAVRSEDASAVASALGMVAPEPASWKRGLGAAYAGGVFITPPVAGWTLVVGHTLLPDAEQPDGQWRANLLKLGQHFPEVQMFVSHRIVELHAWARLRAGAVERAYCYSGESGMVAYDEGERTVAERELGFDFGDPNCSEAENDAYWEREGLFPDEDSVMALAGRWSISPVELTAQSAPPALGLVTARPRRPWWRFW